MANYSRSPGAVWVSLIDNVAMNSDAQGDTFSGVENIAGSMYDDTLIGDNGANVIFGGYGADVLFGLGGDDILDGHRGVDTMFGGAGSDTYLVYDTADVVVESGGQGSDRVITTVSYFLPSGADVEYLVAASGFDPINLTGNGSGNEIIGNFGDNLINGGGGRDYLTGGFGQDRFRFDAPLDARFNIDVITDFNVADDTILLQDTTFSAFAVGPVEDGRFVVGTAALDANDNLIYDPSTGALYYDSDGNGGTAAIQFATLSRGLALTHLDFDVI
jgi:Ca2+-binding RTX toxin-like protein